MSRLPGLEGPIVIVAPHPDDEVLGCGGVMARAAREDVPVYWVIVTDMAASEAYSEQRIVARRGEIEAISELFGLAGTRQLAYAPARLFDRDIPALVREFGAILDELRPTTLLVPSERDAHTDHAITHRAAVAAAKAFRRPWVRLLLAYEVLSETGQNHSISAHVFRPNLHVGLEPADIELKVRALEAYVGEFAPFPFPRSTRAVRALADLRGAECGQVAAEAFEILRSIR